MAPECWLPFQARAIPVSIWRQDNHPIGIKHKDAALNTCGTDHALRLQRIFG